MIKIIAVVFVGGAVGAMLREFLMLIVPSLADGFPLDILAANLVASFLLGFATALHGRKVLSDGVNSLMGTGIAGGLSTFSSFAYGVAVLATASATSAVVPFAYVVVSLVLGYVAVTAGLMLGRQRSN
ncbi:MAG: CrcB family protein [Burkholderiales bacterium]